MSHDQLFKELLQAFFREFMELFYLDVAARLDFSRVSFLDKETFTDFPQGDQREADIVAQVYTLGRPASSAKSCRNTRACVRWPEHG